MKKIILVFAFITSLSMQAQPYQLINGGFETIYGTQPTATANYYGFKQGNLGPSWYAYTGSARSEDTGFMQINAASGNRFAHAYHKVFHDGQWNRHGQTFFMYYPMAQGQTYTVSFKMQTKGTFSHFYVIATNDISPNHSINTTQAMDLNISNNPTTMFPNNNIQIVKNVMSPSVGGWTTVTFSYTASQNYNQLLFIPYIDINTSNLTTRHLDFYLDDVSITSGGNPSNLGPCKLNLALNGQNSDTNPAIMICSGETVNLDATGTVDTYLPLSYFIEIHKVDPNGGIGSQWVNNWYAGLPSDQIINLSNLYASLGNYSFTAAEGTTATYEVKLAIFSCANNAWIEKTQQIIVNGGPSYNFGLNLINQVGQTATRKVKGLVPGNYIYKWYVGTTNSGSVISTSDQIQVTKTVAGSYPYTVEVTNLSTGCTTVKTTTIQFIDLVVIDPIKEKGFGRMSANSEKNTLFTVYPNPVRTNLTLRTKEKFDRITILDSNGRIVLETKEAEINVNSLANGLYIIKVLHNESEIYTDKFIKE
ncbi:conserved exported hypothetical protein [Flavobacterium sp. 9AF]|uniref:T9SS type A sorting domain-containing protein n=1 Tax=Flavobacterium sp. 9AF TaxID=2653142 RepID=UPI0012F16BFC|nr:T9SS type A sorting domain-containing protein [Flavobacterium sp. 9AF]VXB90370.1 conserved exported hypothetical protein [Flavobacterium sp. 9AF]